MKRMLSLCLGLMALAFLPAIAQQPAPAARTGHVHGQVLNPTGQPQAGGMVMVSSDGQNSKVDLPVAADGTFSGDVPPGTYYLVYRAADVPKGQMTDEIKGVKIVVGQDLAQNVDMSRQEYVDKMPAEQRKQLEDLKKVNAEAFKANAVISHLNADLKAVAQDKNDINVASQTATQQLGATAARADVEAKANEIRTAKYTDIETLMATDTNAKGDEAILWTNLAFAQAGLKKYDDAITTYKKALDLETAAKKPRNEVIGAADDGLCETYARTGKVDDASQACDAAAKADPTRGPTYLKNEAIIFFQLGNTDAQTVAADKAIAANPNDAILYYVKGQALIQKATLAPDPSNPKVQRIVLPPDCVAAYQKYLDLAPTGPFANEVAGILQQAGQKVSSSYKAPGKGK